MTLLRFRSIAAVLAVVAGCAEASSFGSDAALDGSSGSDGGIHWPDGGADASVFYDASIGSDAAMYCCDVLELLSVGGSGTLSLAPGQAVTIELRARDPFGSPRPSARIDYALIGNPAGSTLQQLYDFTDADGEVRVFVQAGYAEASFQVRLSIGDTTIYVPVTVEPALFTSLPVALHPSVTSLVSDVQVMAFAEYVCDAVDGVPPSAVTALGAGAQSSLPMLASGTEYAILALGVDAGGVTVRQCIDGIDPATDTLLPFDFGLVDPPVLP